MIVVVMGVSGAGKSTIGEGVAARLDVPFLDADDFHTPDALQRMSRGVPLTDSEREPWLDRLQEELRRRELAAPHGAVLACSALKETYRRRLSAGLSAVRWVHLTGDRRILCERLTERRREHGSSVTGPELLDSQLATLEPPADAVTVDVTSTDADGAIGEVIERLGL